MDAPKRIFALASSLIVFDGAAPLPDPPLVERVLPDGGDARISVTFDISHNRLYLTNLSIAPILFTRVGETFPRLASEACPGELPKH